MRATPQERHAIGALLTYDGSPPQEIYIGQSLNKVNLASEGWHTGKDVYAAVGTQRQAIPRLMHRLQEKGIVEIRKNVKYRGSKNYRSKKKPASMDLYRLSLDDKVFRDLLLESIKNNNLPQFMHSDYYARHPSRIVYANNFLDALNIPWPRPNSTPNKPFRWYDGEPLMFMLPNILALFLEVETEEFNQTVRDAISDLSPLFKLTDDENPEIVEVRTWEFLGVTGALHLYATAQNEEAKLFHRKNFRISVTAFLQSVYNKGYVDGLNGLIPADSEFKLNKVSKNGGGRKKQ